MVNTIEEIAELIASAIISKKINEKRTEYLITCLEKKEDELKKQKNGLQTDLGQIEKQIRELVKSRAAFFVSSKKTSEVGERGEPEFDLTNVINSPEQNKNIEQLFQKSLGELITKKCELEESLKEIIIKINEATRDKEELEKFLEIEKYGEDELNDMEMKKESTNWQQAELRNKIAEKRQKIRDRKVMSKNSELEIQQVKKQLYLANKSLPKIPSKFQQLEAKVKTEFQESAKKLEVLSQELITKIEVKTK